jgi:PTH1 family peptidyl-tRNA hydrolase
LIVISDDLALPLGFDPVAAEGNTRRPQRPQVRSSIAWARTEFIRLRIGIMPEHPIANAKNFVLENFGKNEQETLEKVLKNSAEAVKTIIKDGIDACDGKMELNIWQTERMK